MGHVRFYLTALIILLLPAAIGVVAVHASPACEKYVRTYVTVPVRNKVTKATATAWEKWRIGHPNWKPKPVTTRPKYVMTRKEAVNKVAFACEVPLDPDMLTAELPPADFTFPPMDVPMISLPAPEMPEVAEIPVLESVPGAPIYPPFSGVPLPVPVSGFTAPVMTSVPVASPVPEPPTLFLVGLGLIGSAVLLARRGGAPLASQPK